MTSHTEFYLLADDVTDAGVSGLWFTPGDIGKMPDFKGAYVIVIRLGESISIELPMTVAGLLTPGWYVYARSARGSGGIRARVRRHLQDMKTVHWHIDRLTVKSVEMAALVVADGHECELVDKLIESRCFEIAIAGFGSTDCRCCESHLLSSLPSDRRLL